MKRALWPTVWLLVAAMLAAVLAAISGLRFWWAFLIVVAAILINGWVATLEDELPGGLNNPNGTHTPRYATLTGRIIRILGIILALLCLAAVGVYFFGSR
ncbi:hypothetical protein [Collimonas fungivorans]|uniref:hypothetical protein n=1 Tax=Collimonas fungivorans TaxID=158899 RepID=UPI0026EC8EDE|nr:hypothetical protein [Collimonas fungivorans]